MKLKVKEKIGIDYHSGRPYFIDHNLEEKILENIGVFLERGDTLEINIDLKGIKIEKDEEKI